jgi:hypothetical protein
MELPKDLEKLLNQNTQSICRDEKFLVIPMTFKRFKEWYINPVVEEKILEKTKKEYYNLLNNNLHI